MCQMYMQIVLSINNFRTSKIGEIQTILHIRKLNLLEKYENISRIYICAYLTYA